MKYLLYTNTSQKERIEDKLKTYISDSFYYYKRAKAAYKQTVHSPE